MCAFNVTVMTSTIEGELPIAAGEISLASRVALNLLQCVANSESHILHLSHLLRVLMYFRDREKKIL
jgi:hypothetical protein